MEIRLQKLPAILAEGLVILTLLLAVSSGGSRAATMATTVPSSWIKGVNMIGYSPDPYNVANQHDAIGSWKSLGGNAIAFDVLSAGYRVGGLAFRGRRFLSPGEALRLRVRRFLFTCSMP